MNYMHELPVIIRACTPQLIELNSLDMQDHWSRG